MSDWHERAKYHLAGWAEYRMQCRGSVTKGYPSASAGLGTGGVSAHFDDMVREADFAAARICDSVIQDMSDMHRTAIEAHYLLRDVIKHNRRNGTDLLLGAQTAFWERAKKYLV